MSPVDSRKISRRVSVCYEDNTTADNDRQKGYLFMILLALQFGGQPLLTKEFVGPEVIGSSVVIVCEVLKFVLSLVS